jgi:hypothetical protein
MGKGDRRRRKELMGERKEGGVGEGQTDVWWNHMSICGVVDMMLRVVFWPSKVVAD